jgi:hypothetical protein
MVMMVAFLSVVVLSGCRLTELPAPEEAYKLRRQRQAPTSAMSA